MRYLILSDIHGNLEALESVLQYKDYDNILVLGDLVGYGANPNEIVEWIRNLSPLRIIRGNHDKVVAGVHDGDRFVSHAQAAAVWSRAQLTEENLQYIRDLPPGPIEIDGLMTLAHGSPSDEDEYILGEMDARCNFDSFSTPLCFYGHSHIAVAVGLPKEGPSLWIKIPRHADRMPLDFENHLKYLINPGSVGQPRDGDWRGSAAVYDTESRELSYLRFDYDIHKAQSKIREAGLPAFLADRLSEGR